MISPRLPCGGCGEGGSGQGVRGETAACHSPPIRGGRGERLPGGCVRALTGGNMKRGRQCASFRATQTRRTDNQKKEKAREEGRDAAEGSGARGWGRARFWVSTGGGVLRAERLGSAARRRWLRPSLPPRKRKNLRKDMKRSAVAKKESWERKAKRMLPSPRLRFPAPRPLPLMSGLPFNPLLSPSVSFSAPLHTPYPLPLPPTHHICQLVKYHYLNNSDQRKPRYRLLS